MELNLNPLVLGTVGILGASLLFNLIALGSVSWAVFSLNGLSVNSGLWRGCIEKSQPKVSVCVEMGLNYRADWERAVAAMMCLATIAAVCAMVVSVLPVFLKLRTKLLMAVAALVAAAAALFSFIAVCVFGVEVADLNRILGLPQQYRLRLGWSFALAVVHTALSLAGAVCAGVTFLKTGQFE